LGGDKIRAQARRAQRAADDLLHFAFMQVNAGTEHDIEITIYDLRLMRNMTETA
jgi:hypothetical protein